MFFFGVLVMLSQWRVKCEMKLLMRMIVAVEVQVLL